MNENQCVVIQSDKSLLGDISLRKPRDCELGEPSRCQATDCALEASKLLVDGCIEIACPHEVAAGNNCRNLLWRPCCFKWRRSADENVGTNPWLHGTAVIDA